MKSIIAQKGVIYLFILFLPSILSAQNIPNGGFEDVFIDTEFPSQSYPINWMPFHWSAPNIECFPYLPQGILSEESRTGNFSIKMETHACEEVGNGLVHRPSGYSTGNPGMWSPKGWSLEYDNRPEYLNFYYKFNQESTDSAYAEIMLFSYDSLTPNLPSILRVDAIGFGQGIINTPVENYTLFQLPIVYFSDSVPSFVSIVFSSGKKNNCTLSSCTPGTTLWVDDVSVLGGTVGAEQIESLKNKISIYPNPASHSIRILSKSESQILNISLDNILGQELKVWNALQDEFWIGDLPVGSYFIRIETSEGIAVQRLIKTN